MGESERREKLEKVANKVWGDDNSTPMVAPGGRHKLRGELSLPPPPPPQASVCVIMNADTAVTATVSAMQTHLFFASVDLGGRHQK